MKILAMADLHGNMEVYDQLQALAEKYPVAAIILAGDLLSGHEDDLTVEEAQWRERDQILKLLRRLLVPVLYVMGNDDMIELSSDYAQIQSLHAQRIELNGYTFVGYQYSLPFMGGIFEKPEAGIRKDLEALEELFDKNTVFVTHSPAYGILDRTFLGENAGSKSILELIRKRKVRIHIHGHIHKCYGRQDIHFNVSADARLRGMVIDLADGAHTIIDCPEEKPAY